MIRWFLIYALASTLTLAPIVADVCYELEWQTAKEKAWNLFALVLFIIFWPVIVLILCIVGGWIKIENWATGTTQPRKGADDEE